MAAEARPPRHPAEARHPPRHSHRRRRRLPRRRRSKCRRATTHPGDPKALKGGKFVQWTNSYPTHLNYYGPDRDATLAYLYAEAFFSPLINVHLNTLEYVPCAASSWEVSEDQKTIVFHMDPDAKWSDGKPITAQDVAFTIDLIRNPKVNELQIKADLDHYFPDKPEVIDDRTIKFVGKESTWRNLLFFAGAPIYPAHAVNPETFLEDWKFTVPVLSGPYQLGKYEKDNFITLDRRKDFWGEKKRWAIGTYNFDSIVTKVVLEENLAFEKLKKGEVDFFLVTRAQMWHEECDFDKVKKGWIQKTRMKTKQPEVPSQMAFNLTHPIFKDVKVRKALFWLLDREQLHDQLFFNEYVNKNSYFPNSPYENPSNEKVSYNPEKGKALLAEAGWTKKDKDGILMKDGKRLEFEFIYIHPDAERVYTPLQESFRKNGVKMNLKLMAPPAWIKVSQKKDFELIYANWGPTAFPEVRDQWHSERADLNDTNNIGRFKNPEVDKLIDEYEKEPVLEKRFEILQKMDAIIYDQCPYLLDWYADNWRLLWWNKLGMPEWLTYATLDPREIAWKVWWFDPEKAARLEDAQKNGKELPLAPENSDYWKTHKS
ncbi:MAG: extracellular solute-binding protein [Acidobacteriota bacterium]